MKLIIIQKRKIFYFFSGALMVISILSLLFWGLKFGIDFTGGSLMEVSFQNLERPNVQLVTDALKGLNLGEIKAQPAGEENMILRFKNVDEATHQNVLQALRDKFKAPVERNGNQNSVAAHSVIEEKFETVGPIVGQELKQKTWWVIFLAALMIVIYIAFAFRKISKPVSSWKYGVAAILAVIHDIFIVTGLFSILGHFAGMEVDSLFITALLTILGFSVHDTIVVFDRARENLVKHYSGNFEEVFNDSINQTIARSINTSLTTLIVLATLYFFGGQTIANFVLALIVGIIIGTYSSIFVASPIVIDWYYWAQKKRRS